VALFFLLGLLLGDLLSETTSELDATQLFVGFLIYAVLAFLFIRFMIQPLNTLNLQVYQSLPIPRKKLLNFIILKPIYNPVNYLSLFLVVPFAINTVGKNYGVTAGIGLVFLCICLIIFNIQFASWIKRVIGGNIAKTLSIFLLFATVAVSVVFLEIKGIFSLYQHSYAFVLYLITQVWTWILPLLIAVLATWLHYRYFQNHFYEEAEKSSAKIKEKVSLRDFSFLNRLGTVGTLIAFRLKLILRHKRTKNYFIMYAVFMLYGFIFYSSKTYENMPVMMFFGAICVVGLTLLSFGQWAYSLDSNHFDFILTKGIKMKDYVASTYYLLAACCFIQFLISLFYVAIYGVSIFWIHLAAMFYCIGIALPLLLFFCSFLNKRLNLDNSSMSFQGVKMKDFIIVLPVTVLPFLYFGIGSIFARQSTLLYILILAGCAGIALHQPLITLCANHLQKRKYALSDGFKETE
jgi:hypothetical protein